MTTSSSSAETESVFPAECHFKIIAEPGENTQTRLETALRDLGLPLSVEEGNRSTGGRYQTYDATLTVETRERMVEIDRALAAVDGVKMVL